MNCKKCGAEGIEEQAFNAPRGGFLCKACYRKLQWKCVGIGLFLAAVGLVVAIAFIVTMVLMSWSPGS